MNEDNPGDRQPIRSVLLVCMGNICRSPMAEGLLRHRLTEAGLDDRLRIDSAGTGGWHAGAAPDTRAIRICDEHGVDIRTLRARAICADDYTRFDLILCADRENLGTVRGRQPPGSTATTALLLDWAGAAGQEVPDPYSGGPEDFRHVYELLDSAIGQLLARMQHPA